MSIQIKFCPYCGKEIQANTEKCRYCSQFLDEFTPETVRQAANPNKVPSGGTQVNNSRFINGSVAAKNVVFGDQNKTFKLPAIQNSVLVTLGTIGGGLIFELFLGPFLDETTWMPDFPIPWRWVGAILGFIVTLALVIRGNLPNLVNTHNFIPIAGATIAGAIVFGSFIGPFLEAMSWFPAEQISWWWIGAVLGFMLALNIIDLNNLPHLPGVSNFLMITFWIVISAILFTSFIGPFLDSTSWFPDLPLSWLWVGVILGFIVSLGADKGFFAALPIMGPLFSIIVGTIIGIILFDSYVGPSLEATAWFPSLPISWAQVGGLVGFIVSLGMAGKR